MSIIQIDETMFYNNLATRIKEARRIAKMSQDALAQHMDTTQQAISIVECGDRKASALLIKQVSDATGLPIEWFYNGD